MQGQRIKVLFAIPELDKAGPDRVLFELLKSLDRERFEPMLMVSNPDGYYLARLPADVRIEVLPRAKVAPRYPVVEAVRFIRHCAPDVVFATLRMTVTVGLGAWAIPRRSKLVLRQANDLTADFAVLMEQSLVKHRLARQLTMLALRQADAVVCQSEAMKTDLGRLLGATTTLRVIGNPIDVEEVARFSTASPSRLEGSPALVSVGRLGHQKGYDLLLGALATIRADYPALHLTIFGEGPDRTKLQSLARQLDLERNVTFAGFSNEPLPAVRAADLFVLSSRYEGFPNAALEALACGTPIVLTDCPGANAQIVRPGVNGRLAESIDAAAFSRALRAAIEELQQYERAEIIADTRARFGAPRIVGAYEELFASCVNRTAQHQAGTV